MQSLTLLVNNNNATENLESMTAIALWLWKPINAVKLRDFKSS